MAEEIALFIDFENIRYSLLNTQHREPDPQELINVARRYGTVMVAKAYADWSRQPEMFKGSLTAAMIDRVDCPAKQRDRYRSATWQPGQPAQPGNGNNTSHAGWNNPGDSTVNNSSFATVSPVNPSTEENEGDSEATREISQIRLNTPEPTPDPVAVVSPSATNGNGTTQFGTQSTVDLNMLMDIIETVFDRPTISTFVLMTGDRDFTRICARLKLRLNKFVVVAGVPGTVSRDLTAAANQFVLLGNHMSFNTHPSASIPAAMPMQQMGMEPTDPQFLQFLDYIDRHWAWRTVIGVSNFIGDPYNHKNRFRGRLTRESARDLLQTCIQQGILLVQTDNEGNEDLRLNRANLQVEAILASTTQQQSAMGTSMPGYPSASGYASSQGYASAPGYPSPMGQWNQPQQQAFPSTPSSPYPRRTTSIMSNLIESTQGTIDDDQLDDEEEGMEMEEGVESEEE